MSLSELKSEIIQQLNLPEDAELLTEIRRLMEINQQSEDVYELSEEQKSALQEARADYKKGNTLTNDEANNQIEAWLKK